MIHDEPAIDRLRLAGFTNGDPDLEDELLALFVATAQGYIERLRSGLGDAAAWREAAHALKGASGNLGAPRLAALAREAEHLPDDGASTRSEILLRLEAALDEVRREQRKRARAT